MRNGSPRAGVESRAYTAVAALALLLAFTPAALAESGAYRIEVLVFRHETGEPGDPRETDRISDYPGAWRLPSPAAVLLPEDPAPLGVTSERMQAAWRRLENSAAYTPLLFRAWEQSRIDYHPPVRLHDDEVLAQRFRWPDGTVYLDLGSDDIFAPYRQRFFRLDGTVQLRRTRFLHLDLNLEYRHELVYPEPAEAGSALIAFAPAAETQRSAMPPDSGALPLPVPPGARVHRLRESRQIRTEDLLYFDTPYLGVLARVTETAGE